MKRLKKVITFILAATILSTMLFGLTACSDDEGKKEGFATVEFVYSGKNEIMALYKKMVEEYNAGQGQIDKVYVRASFVPVSGQDGQYANTLTSSNGPDVVIVADEYFKKHTSNMEDLTGLFEDSLLSDLYENQLSRYYYNVATNTSNSSDSLYGLPVYNDTTVLYYNKTALEANGVICISVAEEDLDAFNAGAADANGKTKADYGIADVTVPARGFYRSKLNFVPADDEYNGKSWKKKQNDEVMIFNDQIACSWDEIEDVGLWMTKSRNSSSTTEYGYYTEWWFNYGWGVGGDCMLDLTGNGDYVFSLCDDMANYIVAEGKTYTGLYTGTVYQAGETLNRLDVINANKGDDISYKTDGSTYYYYTVNGTQAAIRDDMTAKVEAGVLQELPSTQQAFKRFCYLAGSNGLKVCPSPSAFNATTSVQYFTSNQLAFLVEKVSNMEYINKNGSFEWGVAPLPVYKKYTNDEPDCDEVAVQGVAANHSNGYAISVRKGTPVKEQAVKFITWMMTEGQDIFAQNGQVSSRKSDLSTMQQYMPEQMNLNNSNIIFESIATAKAGDWWYMPDRAWIDNWANPLNSGVRYGTMTFDDFIYRYIEVTNKALSNYKN